MAIPTTASATRRLDLVREKMGLDEDKIMTTFQSRFGREPWLQPYTDKTLEGYARSGYKASGGDLPGLFL